MNKSILTLHSKYILCFSFLGLVFGLIMTQTIYPVALYSLIIVLFLIVFIHMQQFTSELKGIQFIPYLMLASIFIKTISLFFFENLMLDIVGIPFLSYADDYTYDKTSSEILNAWEQRGIGFYKDVKYSTGFYSGYPNFSALAKYFFGDHYLVPRFLNVVFSTLTIPVFYNTIKCLNDNERLNKVILIIFSFSPAFIVYSSLQLKETILIFFLSTLIYGAVNFFHKGMSIKSILFVSISMCVLFFFRAAILLPFIVSIILATLLSKGKESGGGLQTMLWLALVSVAFYFFWEYFYNSGLLALTGEEYFESRFSIRESPESYKGTNDIEKLGFIAALLAPLLAMLSIFLPAPIYIKLDPLSNTVPYHYIPLIGYYAILPMVCVSLLYIVKNHKAVKVGVFIMCFFITYKLGQAGGKSILDSRQSLPVIYAAYLLLAYFDFDQVEIREIWIRYRIPILLVILIVMFCVTFVRYIIRQ